MTKLNIVDFARPIQRYKTTTGQWEDVCGEVIPCGSSAFVSFQHDGTVFYRVDFNGKVKGYPNWTIRNKPEIHERWIGWYKSSGSEAGQVFLTYNKTEAGLRQDTSSLVGRTLLKIERVTYDPSEDE